VGVRGAVEAVHREEVAVAHELPFGDEPLAVEQSELHVPSHLSPPRVKEEGLRAAYHARPTLACSMAVARDPPDIFEACAQNGAATATGVMLLACKGPRVDARAPDGAGGTRTSRFSGSTPRGFRSDSLKTSVG